MWYKHDKSLVKIVGELEPFNTGGRVGLDRVLFVKSRADTISSHIRHKIDEVIMNADSQGNPLGATIEGGEFRKHLKELEKMIAW